MWLWTPLWGQLQQVALAWWEWQQAAQAVRGVAVRGVAVRGVAGELQGSGALEAGEAVVVVAAWVLDKVWVVILELVQWSLMASAMAGVVDSDSEGTVTVTVTWGWGR